MTVFYTRERRTYHAIPKLTKSNAEESVLASSCINHPVIVEYVVVVLRVGAARTEDAKSIAAT